MSDRPAVEDPSLEVLLGRIADEFTQRLNEGEQPQVEEYAARYPELATVLREVLPALLLIRLPAGSANGSGPAADGEVTPDAPLGDFQIVREIGRGGMGVVYEAEQLSLGRRVALKVLPFAAALDPRQLQRFQNEARAAAGLHHTNIVPVYGVGCARGVHYYAMQLIDGRTLAALIAEQRGELLARMPTVSEREAAAASATTAPPAAQATSASLRHGAYFRRAAEWAIQAAEALDHAHSLGVVHRDVKPGNLLVDAGGRLWVTDFGLAQVQTEAGLTLTGDLVGTLRYMSPEQALAKRVVIDHRTDVYSLGATLYELLTLRPVFGGNDRQELLRQIAFEEPWPLRRINKAIPVELEVIVLKALEKNPAERYSTAQELAEDLRRWLDDRPIRARRPSLGQRLRKWGRRHRTGAAAAMICLLAILTVLGGSIGWMARDWEARREDAVRRAGDALKSAETFLEQENWPEGVRSVEQAEGFLAGFEAETALRLRARGLRKDLHMADQLQEARLRTADIRDGHFDWAATDEAYATAFREYGLDVDPLDPETAAQQIRARPIRQQLVAALDDWAYTRWVLKGEGVSQRLATARVADPDRWRNRLRDALEGTNPNALKLAAAADQAEDWPAPTLVLLGRFAKLTASSEQGVAVLRRAQQRHPDDFWINVTLADLLGESRPPHLDETIRFCSIAVALRRQSPAAHINLGVALQDKGQLDEAISEYLEAIRLKEADALAHNYLANALHYRGRNDHAITESREALRLKPDFPEAHNNLGIVLADKGRLDEAITEFREALRLKPDFPEAHNNLGNGLQDKGQLDDAISEWHEAVRLKADYSNAHYNLGNALRRKGRLDEAISEYREALRLKPDFGPAHNNLGIALADKGRLDEAISEYREALRLESDDPVLRNNLGSALQRKGRLDEAITEYREALRLKPDYPLAHSNLGTVLEVKGQLDDAITECHEALRLEPDYPEAHFSLGNALRRKGQFDDAISEYRETLRLKPDYPDAHNNFGVALVEKGRLDEAICEWREALRLNKSDTHARENLRRAEQLARLDKRLPAVLQGKEQLTNATERLAFAQLCQLYRKWYATAARFYEEAFSAEPQLAEKLDAAGNRYDAACAAALAGNGQGEDAQSLDDKERARLRRQALNWLRADLAAWQKLLELEPDQARAGAAQQLAHWLEDTDFAGVRGDQALAKLPEVERADWQKLWQEVDALRQRAATPPPPAAPQPQEKSPPPQDKS
jgi:Flp pilus assembly protein TadD/serine/threonine protein kinase